MALPLGHRPTGRAGFQYLTGDMIRAGIGLMRVEPIDFRRDRRAGLARAIEAAYNAGRFTHGSPLHILAVRVHGALISQESMLAALRTHLGYLENGNEDRRMMERLTALSQVVLSLDELVTWVERG